MSKNKSNTELGVGFMRSLCMGEIEEGLLFPYPQMKPTEQETLRSMQSALETWLKPYETSFRKWDQEGAMPPEVVKEIASMGLFGLIIPEEYGGLGFSTTAYSRTLQELARYDASIALTVGAHSSIGMRGLLLFGTPEQKAKYCPLLANGENIAAFCLTEPGSGSDAASIRTKAVKDGDDWVISGEKLWITNGEIAEFFTVFAKTDTPDGMMTAFIVTRSMKGVTTGPHEDKMGIRASCTTTVNLDQVRVPADHVLGEVGKGFKVAMKILNSGRTGLGGGCTGAMKKLIELANKQAKERKQFGKSISDYGLIKEKLGRMMVACYTTEATVNLVSGLIDQGHDDYAVEAAISKVYATENLWMVVDEALQIAAGNGYMREFPYERMMRDARINRIFEGTNEILRLFIALTGMHDVGKSLKELSKSLDGIFVDPIKGFGVLSEYGFRRLSQVVKVGGTKSSFTKAHPSLQVYATAIEDMVRDLAWASDRLLRKHGKNIIGKQLATKRLAEVMIDLFVLSCTLSRVSHSVTQKGPEASEHERQILQAAVGEARRRCRENLSKIDDNQDESIKILADLSLQEERYPWDNL